MRRKEYCSERFIDSFDPERCIHASYFVRGLPEVFDPSNRPWVRPERAKAELVAEVVMRCPSGALQFELTDGTTEPIPQQNTPSRHLGE